MIFLLLCLQAEATPSLADLDAAVPDSEAVLAACRSRQPCDRSEAARGLYTLILRDWVYGEPVGPRQLGTLEHFDPTLFAMLPEDVRTLAGERESWTRPYRGKLSTEGSAAASIQAPAPVVPVVVLPAPVPELQTPPSPVERAISLQERGEIAEARQIFAGVKRGERGYFEAQFRLGLIFRQIGETDNAISAFRRTARGDTYRTAAALLQLGEIYEDLEKSETARSWYDLAAMSDGPYGQRAMLRSAWLAHESGDDHEAGRLFHSLEDTAMLADFPLMSHRLRVLSELPNP